MISLAVRKERATPMSIKHITLIVLLGLLIYGGWFVFRNIRGARPAFGPIPSVPIVSPEPNSKGKEAVNTTGLPLSLPDSISVSYFAKNLSAPRVLAWDPKGTLLASIPSQSKVVALPDANRDGVADATATVVDGLTLPHGIAFHSGLLYIAETDQVASYTYDPQTMKAANKKKLFDLPAGGNHFSRTIGFGPDGKLYVSIGSSCNVCVEKDPRRAKVYVANPDGSDFREYASGLRNSVFFVWHQQTKEMWATDMARDLLGDNTPPEEVNIVKSGGFYGWPYCYNNRIHDRSFDKSDEARKKCEGSVAPHITFQAHSAPLGLAFIPDSWPSEYRGDLLVSYHGSWNRSQPTGYKVARFNLDADRTSTGESDFIAGFLQGDGALGRPVDLLFDATGTLFVSDDKSGAIYRVSISQK